MNVALLPQVIALLAALTVGAPPDELAALPDRFAAAAVSAAARPVQHAITRLEESELVAPEVTDNMREHVFDASVVGRAVIAAGVRTPITVRAVPRLIHDDLDEGKTLPEAAGEAADDVAAAVHQNRQEIRAALQRVRQDSTSGKKRSTVSAQGEVRSSPVRGQLPKVTVRSWDVKDVRAATTEQRAHLQSAVAQTRAKATDAVKKVRAAFRAAAKPDQDTE